MAFIQLFHTSALKRKTSKKQTTDSILSINESLQENLCRVREMGVIWNLSFSPFRVFPRLFTHGGTSAGGQSVNGGGGHRPYGGNQTLIEYIIN